MFLPIESENVWLVEDIESPAAFVRGLRGLLQDGDVLVFGAYEPSEATHQFLMDLDAGMQFHESVYSTTFHCNRIDHPRGRPFELFVRGSHFEQLEALAIRKNGQRDKQLFFDHVLAFRVGEGATALFDFHDAFNGGCLCVSGEIEESVVSRFAEVAYSRYRLACNPALSEET